ncbi:hypothetical protein IMSAGC019_01233 [Lachnospiraceae bacterium]|nr:hypothetical protein IMSAGC019_01233 [Lachnospiraceae bacterium]
MVIALVLLYNLPAINRDSIAWVFLLVIDMVVGVFCI